jgi:large subunit ribosomal protein L3
MKFILGKKEKMVEFFTPEGTVVPATLVSAGPITVTQVKTVDKDGYASVQVGYNPIAERKLTKALKGHMKDKGAFRFLREFDAGTTGEPLKDGDTIDVSTFLPGDMVSVSGISKGKGFQGVVKRHGFHGGRRTHGQKHSEREAGSIGGGLRNRVPKGMRMAGRMGGDRITVKNLKVIAVDNEQNTLILKGAVPGARGTLLEVVAQ